jgi:uncharacterized protein YkwD
MLRVILVVALTACASEPAPRQARRPPAPSSPAAMRPLLDAHNRYRARHCAPPLAWSRELARSAKQWADSLVAQGCAFGHSGTRHGENLAAGTQGSLGPEDAARMWYEEVAKYDFKKGRFSMDTGHFTQVVWKGTQRLGCGTARCKGLEIFVCQYDPPGNVQGEFQRNVLPTSCR